MRARWLAAILPAMTLAEAIETTRIHHVAGRTGDRTALVTTRPFGPPTTLSRTWGGSAAATCRGRARCRWRTTACRAWTNSPSAADTCSRSYGNRWRWVYSEYYLPRVVDL